MKQKILFVCTGNICRSPMAVALFNERASRAGHSDAFEVSSAGTWAPDGERATLSAQTVMLERGLDITRHRARTVTREMLDDTDLILVMTMDHKAAITAEFSSARPKAHLISELIGQQYDLADPYGRSLEDYESCATELSRILETGYPRVAEWLGLALPSRE